MAKTGAWYHGGMARPVALDIADGPAKESTSTTKPDPSPPNEKRAKLLEKQQDSSQGSEKENHDRNRDRGSFSRAGSLQGRELKRQYSMSDAANRGHGHDQGVSGSQGQNSSGIQQSDADKLREHGQIPERGRGKERGSSKHRFHSESRLSETDRRYASDLDRDRDRDRDREHRDRDRDRGSRSDRESSSRGPDGKAGHADERGNYRDGDRKSDRHR